MPRGHVRWFNADRGFGFIAEESGSIRALFVHVDQTKEAGTRYLGDRVEIEIFETRKGAAAIDVRRWSRDDDGDEAAHSTVATAWQGTKPRRSR